MASSPPASGAAPAEPELLDVVPWNYGFAHAWALRWLVGYPDSRAPVMNLLVGQDRGPWELTQPLECEQRIEGARADLVVRATDRRGRLAPLAVEVKVADPIKDWQLAAYRDGGFAPVLYVPGLTGLMYAPNGPVAGERWVTGSDLAQAVDGVPLPHMIRSYIVAVRTETERMDLARAFSRDEVEDFPHDGQARYQDLMDAAWVAEVALAMTKRGATDVLIRPQANDRGLYWRGSQRVLAGGAELYLDVVADLRTHHCAIALKVKGGDLPGRQAAYEWVRALGPPTREGWVPGRRSSAASGRVWTLDASHLNAAETAQYTLDAGAFIARLPEQLP